MTNVIPNHSEISDYVPEKYLQYNVDASAPVRFAMTFGEDVCVDVFMTPGLLLVKSQPEHALSFLSVRVMPTDVPLFDLGILRDKATGKPVFRPVVFPEHFQRDLFLDVFTTLLRMIRDLTFVDEATLATIPGSAVESSVQAMQVCYDYGFPTRLGKLANLLPQASPKQIF